MLQGMFRSNFVLFGIPISTALFGDTAAGLASILIAVIIPLYNVLAVISLEMFNGKKPKLWKDPSGHCHQPADYRFGAGGALCGVPRSPAHAGL